ncbi:MAG: FHA domain-containing protein [Planctomycetota bacterium]|jgi:pSer/pThr/pTyr-binding forkhead associated (FHA) protein
MDVKLVMFKADGQRKDFPVKGETTLIGRAQDCDLRIPLGSVSRKHCEMEVSGQDVRVKDLDSANGTYVNSTRVEEVVLGAGDRLVIGPVVFTLQIDGEPGEIEPVKTPSQVSAEDSAVGVGIEDVLEMGGGGLDESGAISLEETAAPIELEESSAGDFDPIAALEALAGEGEDEEEGELKA